MIREKTLLVYYSFEGNSELVADIIKKETGIKAEKLVPDKEPPRKGPGKFLAGGGSIIKKQLCGLDDLKNDPAQFDEIILLCPVWASSFPPAIRTFLTQNDIKDKKVYMIGCSSSGHAEKMFAKAGEFIGTKIERTLSLRDPLKFREEAEAGIKGFLESI